MSGNRALAKSRACADLADVDVDVVRDASDRARSAAARATAGRRPITPGDWISADERNRLRAAVEAAERDRSRTLEHEALMKRVLAAPGPRLSTVISVDEGTAGMLDDLVVRARELESRETTPGGLLDAAITRFLDAAGWPRSEAR